MVTEHPGEDTLEFDNLVRLDVETDESWKSTYTSYRDYFRYSWNDVWTGTAVDRGFSFLNMTACAGNSTSPENNESFKLFPTQLTEMILDDRMWDPVRFTSSLATK